MLRFLLRYPTITFGNAGCEVLQHVKSNLQLIKYALLNFLLIKGIKGSCYL